MKKNFVKFTEITNNVNEILLVENYFVRTMINQLQSNNTWLEPRKKHLNHVWCQSIRRFRRRRHLNIFPKYQKEDMV